MSYFNDFLSDNDSDLALMDAYEPDGYDRKLRRRGTWEGYFQVEDLPWDASAEIEPMDDAELDELFRADCCAACGAEGTVVTNGRDSLCDGCYQDELRHAA
jgi:hypothetical protein